MVKNEPLLENQLPYSPFLNNPKKEYLHHKSIHQHIKKRAVSRKTQPFLICCSYYLREIT